MGNALGMIETVGVIGTVEAADAMLKAATVDIEKYEKIGAGYTTTFIRGNVGAVRSALDAGLQAAERVCEPVIAVHMIPNVDEQILRVIFNSKVNNQTMRKPRAVS